MSDLKTVLAETLREALASEHPFNGGTFPRWFRVWINEASEKAADALLGLPGVAVTQLPEPSHAGTVSTSFRHVTYWHSVHQVRGEKRLITVDDPGRCMSADEARVLAADLLAAAAALSVEGNTNA